MLAIIPARGGSKGLPGKNIKLLNRKPLIAYTIEAALRSKEVTRVIVSTDDEEIAKIAKEYGAEIPFLRPAHLASDKTLSIDVYEYTIQKLEEDENIIIENFIILQPTSPLRTSEDIDSAIKLFKENNAFSVISFCQEHHPISWHKYVEDNNKIESIFEVNLLNRQDNKPTFFPNGAIYVFDKEVIETRNYYSENTYAYIMKRNYSVDIDTIEDFEYASYLINNLSALND